MFRTNRLVVVPFGARGAAANMAIDVGLLEACERNPDRAFLRFYTWTPAALSLGRFESASTVDAGRARTDGVDVVRRPTGGRVVLHAEDLTYTVTVARDQWATVGEAYHWVSERLVAGLRLLGAEVETARGAPLRSVARQKPCFLSAARHEIVHQGRKLVGSAQRLGRRALLQHGSLPVGPAYLRVVDYLAGDQETRDGLAQDMRAGTVCLEAVLGRRPGEAEVAAALEKAFLSGFGVPATCLSEDTVTAWSDPGAHRGGWGHIDGGVS